MSGPGFLILWLNNLEQTNWSYNVPLVFVKPLVLGLIFRKHAHDHVDSTCIVRLGIALPSLISFLKWSHNFGASIGTYHFIIVGSMCSYGFAPATRTQIGGPSVRAVTEITCHLATAYKKIIICKKPSKTETAAFHSISWQLWHVSETPYLAHLGDQRALFKTTCSSTHRFFGAFAPKKWTFFDSDVFPHIGQFYLSFPPTYFVGTIEQSFPEKLAQWNACIPAPSPTSY
jgi:hypothetical protein